MRTIISYINNLIFPLIPESKAFGFKRFMLRIAGATVGSNVKVSSSCKIFGAGNLTIGDNTWVGYECTIVTSSNIVIGKNVDIAPGVYIGTGTHEIDAKADRIAARDISRDVTIGNGCWICVNSTILPGSEIGNKCVVAAVAVVGDKFCDEKVLIAGVPAKIVKRYD